MSAIFEMPIPSETLTQDEISDITGCSRKGEQIQWLHANSWIFHKNKAGEPVIGRLYARLKLAGITPAAMTVQGGWLPDFSTLK